MAGSKGHAIAGFGAALLVYYFDSKKHNEEISLMKALLVGSIGASVAILPDLLEPATTPNHRNHFHSIITGTIPATYLKHSLGEDASDQSRWIKQAAASGYLSHLVLDGCSPKSLPLF